MNALLLAIVVLAGADQPRIMDSGLPVSGGTLTGNLQFSSATAWLYEPTQTTDTAARDMAIMAGHAYGKATGTNINGGNLYLSGGLGVWQVTVTNYALSVGDIIRVITWQTGAAAAVSTTLTEGTSFTCHGTSNNTCATNLGAAIGALSGITVSVSGAVVYVTPNAASTTSVFVGVTDGGVNGAFCTLVGGYDGAVILDAGAKMDGTDAFAVKDNYPTDPRYLFLVKRDGGVTVSDYLIVGTGPTNINPYWSSPSTGSMLSVGNDLTSLGTSVSIATSVNQADFIEISGYDPLGFDSATRKFTFADTCVGSSYACPGIEVFGLKVAGSPAVKADGAALSVRHGDDSGFGALEASQVSIGVASATTQYTTLSSTAGGALIISAAPGQDASTSVLYSYQNYLYLKNSVLGGMQGLGVQDLSAAGTTTITNVGRLGIPGSAGCGATCTAQSWCEDTSGNKMCYCRSTNVWRCWATAAGP